jgi:DNA-binding HxlR family transcriptional regulator
MNDDLSSLNFIATILSSKWTLPVVYVLKNHTRRYHEIHIHLPNTTQKMLTATLRKLERDGLVKRKIHASIPPKVEYRLTPFGLEVLLLTQRFNDLAQSNQLINEAQMSRANPLKTQ